MKKILIVDDVEMNRELLSDILSSTYEIDTASNGAEAIEKLKGNNKYSLILLDIQMPVIDGYGVMDYMNENGLFLVYPVIIISGANEVETETKCFDYAVSDFIAKPYKEPVVLRRVANVISSQEYQRILESELEKQHNELECQYEILMEQTKRLEETNSKIIDILGNMVESRNLESGTHVKRVCGFTKILGMQYMKNNPEINLTPEKIDLISKAAALHDIGKISIPDHILLKPGRLTSDEFELMKTHTILGCQVLNKIEGIWDDVYKRTTYEICKYHHERFDGNGYPEHKKEDEIPLSAQLVSIADVYDALVTTRVYKDAYSKEDAYKMIISGQCGTFSPKLLKAFEGVRMQFEEFADKTAE